MRRACATLLLAVLAFWFIAPAMPDFAMSSLPACCRPGGKHHCAMAQPDSSTQGSGPGWRTAAERCPFGPLIETSLPHSIVPRVAPMFVPGADARAPRAPAEAEQAASTVRLHCVRGPPSNLS